MHFPVELPPCLTLLTCCPSLTSGTTLPTSLAPIITWQGSSKLRLSTGASSTSKHSTPMATFKCLTGGPYRKGPLNGTLLAAGQ